MINFLKKHWLVIILAILIGFVYYFPQILFEYQLDSDYQGFYILTSSDEHNKVARVQEIYDGHYLAGNPFAYEYKDSSSPNGVNITELLIGSIGRVLHLSAVQVILLFKFILPIILFLLLYYLSFLITGSKIGSLITPCLILLGSHLKSPQLIPDIIKQIINFQFEGFLVYLRPSHPSFSSIFFFTGFIFLFLFFKTRKLSYGFLAGLALGLLFYIYAFFWVFTLVLFGVIIGYLILKRDWHFLKKTLLILLLGLSIGSFYLYSYFDKGSFETTVDSFQIRQTFFLTHHFIFDKIVVVPFLIYSFFLLYLYKRNRFKKEFLFPYFLLIASLIVSNQQVITGHEIQYHHWYWFTNLPAAFFASSILAIYFLENLKIKNLLKNSIILLILLFLIVFGTGIQYSAYQIEFPRYQYYQNYSYIFNWLNKNTSKDSVVYSDYHLSDFIPAFTHNNVYWSNPIQYNATTPLERVFHNYFVYIKVNFNPDEKEIRPYLQEHKAEVSYLVLSFKVIEAQYGSRTGYPDNILDFLAEEYKKFLQLPLEEQLGKYRLDYLVWDYNKYPNIYIDLERFFESVFEYQGIIIYKIK